MIVVVGGVLQEGCRFSEELLHRKRRTFAAFPWHRTYFAHFYTENSTLYVWLTDVVSHMNSSGGNCHFDYYVTKYQK